jgi:seryl-tRNA synthetase
VGTPRAFDFERRDHLELGQSLELLDFESASKVTGQKFYYLKNEAVLLELALLRFAIEMAREAGYTPHATPDLARRAMVDKMAFSPRGEETQIYSIADTDLDLVGTAEITLGGLGADAIFEQSDLPVRLSGVSHCFRTEAGSHGRESKGLYRVHQFSKVELFAFTTPEQAVAVHEEMLAIEERIMQALELPYRVIDIATGDLGAPAYRKFDVEAWLPGRGESGDYGEVTSTSNCTDFQARRLKARYRRSDAKKNSLVHTLNGTAVAIPRMLIALLENHQQQDGSVGVPKALQAYTGFDRIGPR